MNKAFWIYAGPLLALAVLLSITLVACDPQDIGRKLIPEEQAKAGQVYLESVRLREPAPLLQDADPEIRDAVRTNFNLLANQFPAGAPRSIKVVSSMVTASPGFTQYALAYEYEFADRWLLTDIVLRDSDGKRVVAGLHVQPMKQSLERIHAFTFSGKGLRHYLVFALAVLLPFFILGTVIASVRVLKVRRKWLVVIPIAIGVANLTLNWTTGAVGFSPFAFSLLGAGWFKGFYGPLQLQISLPLGAIVFWLWYFVSRRKQQNDPLLG